MPTKERIQELLKVFLTSLKEVSDRWSTSIFVAIKLLGSLWIFSALIGAIIITTQWFIATYGGGTFVFTLIVASFVISVMTTISGKKVDDSNAKPKDLAKLAGIEEK
jgi:VIT1/CCC1 family predicted Fe2+/Mn2+ transporter